MNKALFIDKDATLIEDVPFNVNPQHVRLLPGSGEGLRLFKEAGYKLIVVTNQSGVARGFFEEKALEGVRKRINELLDTYHVQLDGFYYCPHWPEGTIKPYALDCRCRKPYPGMLLNAAKIHNINLDHSWMIGDGVFDTEAGNRAGCQSILVTSYERAHSINTINKPSLITQSIYEAAEAVLVSQSLAQPFPQLQTYDLSK